MVVSPSRDRERSRNARAERDAGGASGGLENLTQRLSDDYLDLDLLDEQARDVLGLVRANEMIIR